MPCHRETHRNTDRFIAAAAVTLLPAAGFVALIHHCSD